MTTPTTPPAPPNPPKYALTFSLNVLNHLGIGLYSNIPAVLSEMVANAWDAGATLVNITLGADVIVIEDNGRGLTTEEINDRYLRVGYQKRKSEATVKIGNEDRHVMGRKGIGKLAAFSIANIVEVQTSKDGVKNGFIMSLDAIEEGVERGELQYSPQEMPPDQITVERGTKTVLRDIKQPLLGVEDQLRTELARRFSIIGADRSFDVVVNEKPISLKDRNYYDKIQLLWYLGEDSAKYAARCPNVLRAIPTGNVVEKFRGYKVSGWIATVAKPKDIADEHHVISVYAHGKLIQEDILADIQEARIFKQYIIGEIDADFMDADADADIVTSDRQRINKNDKRYILLRDFVTKEIKKIGNSWDDLRLELAPQPQKRGQRKKPADEQPEQPGAGDPPPAGPEGNGADPPTEQPPDAPPEENPPEGAAPPEGEAPPEGSPADNPNPGNGAAPPIAADPTRNRYPPSGEAKALFSSILTTIQGSVLEPEFKRILLYDLEQAKFAYYGRVYKASVIMLGAVVEGLMLGTLRRPEVMEHILNDTAAPQVLQSLGLRNPRYVDRAVFARDLADRLDFEKFRTIIKHYLPFTEHLGIDDVQRFRNAVHPWKCIETPNVYGSYTAARALTHLAALEILVNALLSWTP